jgi:hypothetical protein
MPKRGKADAWEQAWNDRYAAPAAKPKRRLPRWRSASRTGRYGVIGAVLVAAVASPFAVAATSGSRVTNVDDRYAFLARNTRAGDGGAAALACSSDVGSGKEPCLNMVNKGTGLAGAFRTRGLVGFRLQTSGNGKATPFVLDPNATELVKYLNADQVDGLSADEIGHERFARVNVAADNTVTVAGSNGLATTGPVVRNTTGDYTVTFADDVSKCAYQVTSGDPANARIGSAVPVTANTKQVEVQIRDPNSTPTGGAQVDAPFSLTANC